MIRITSMHLTPNTELRWRSWSCVWILKCQIMHCKLIWLSWSFDYSVNKIDNVWCLKLTIWILTGGFMVGMKQECRQLVPSRSKCRLPGKSGSMVGKLRHWFPYAFLLANLTNFDFTKGNSVWTSVGIIRVHSQGDRWVSMARGFQFARMQGVETLIMLIDKRIVNN